MARAPERVVVEKRKWDGTVSARWAALLLTGGDHVAWITAAGTARRRPRRNATDVVARAQASVACGEWWVATAEAGPGRVGAYMVDAALSPVRLGHVLAWIDLDLDLRLGGEGGGEPQDEDQFRRRAAAMGYPPEVCRGARGGLDDAARRHREGRWPFDGWLAERAREAALLPGARLAAGGGPVRPFAGEV